MDHNHMENDGNEVKSCCAVRRRFDWLLWGAISGIVISYVVYFFLPESGRLSFFATSVFSLMNEMWWGLALGLLFVGILAKMPKEFVMSILGKGGTIKGLLRATAGGVLLDLCSHGILVVGMQLYKRGASLGQVMAFLIASPWNSISLTFILWALVGFKWMISILLLSLVIAMISGLIFDGLVKKGILPENPNKHTLPDDFKFWVEAKKNFKATKFDGSYFRSLVRMAWNDSKMILRWIFLGVILAALIRTFVDPESFATYFGPTLKGLGLTILFATVMEVCSEGSVPIAADILTRAKAPGNAFAFLMTGVSTDYTEIIALREATKSWKISLFLPLVTVPQVLLVAWLIGYFG